MENDEKGQFRIAYVLLWFPLASETFIFREIEELVKNDVEIYVYTMYGKRLKGCSARMKDWNGHVFRMGIGEFPAMTASFFRHFCKQPAKVWKLLKNIFFRRMRNVESLLENLWCFYAGFLLSDKCVADGVQLIHSSWANGPATAAWVASLISGIPFAFTGRAGDIYPPDGLLAEKAAAASFIRVNNQANADWLKSFCPEKDKIHLIYNGLTIFQNKVDSEKPANFPPSILAIGRLVRTKGFPELFTAIARLKRENFPVDLVLIGDGAWKGKLEKMIRRLKIEDLVKMPGFVPNDKLRTYLAECDLLVVPSVIYENGDRDGIPNVIMEALSYKKPVIATDVCGISEVVRNGETGFLIPQRDPAAIASAIREALSNPDHAKRMAIKGAELVNNLFDAKANTQKLKALYKKAALHGR